MAYEALARKWRPKNFNELIGQEAIQKTLKNSLEQERLHPVLLFVGPRGTGKTSTARILAKTIRCKNKKQLTPCEKCEDCMAIRQGQSLDVVEIDGASHNGVEAVRDLKENINYMSTSGSYKIYIIDEVHMLSQNAFNALLKTLEEPPQHTLFILATTSLSKIPDTILSRCQRLDFHLIPLNKIQSQLQKICQKEDVSISEEAVWLIAQQAEGSLRDGQSLLDQMITFCKDDITVEKVASVLNLTDPALLFQTLDVLIEKSEIKMLDILYKLKKKGSDPKKFFNALIVHLRNCLMIKLNPSNSPCLVEGSDQEIKQLQSLAKLSSYEDLQLLLSLSLQAEREINLAEESFIALEIVLLRLASAPRIEELTPLTPPRSSSAQIPVQNSTPVQKATTDKKPQELMTWIRFIEELRKDRPKWAAYIENLSLKASSNSKETTLCIPKKLSFSQELQSSEFQTYIEERFNTYNPSSDKLTIIFQNSDEACSSIKENREKIERAQLMEQAKKDSTVQKVNQIFDGSIKDIVKEK